MNITIKKCTKNDGLDYISFKNFVWENTYQNIFPQEIFDKSNARKEKFAENFPTYLNDKNNLYIFAKNENKIVGLLFGTLNSFNATFQNLGFAELGAIYVHPDFQGQGVGKQLKNYFEKWLKENGKDKYILAVLQRNKNAIKAYDTWGGKNTGKISKTEIMGKKYNEIFFEFKA